MKVCMIFTAFFSLILICGCSSIGNGISNAEKIQIQSPQTIEIQGDWHVEIICNAAENSVETVIDGNLRKHISINSSDELDIALPTSIYPMVMPILKIRLQKNFSELSLENSIVCKVSKFSSNSDLEIELDDKAVCTFNDIKAAEINAEISDSAKLSLRGKVKKLDAEIQNRAVLEAAEVEELHLEAEDNSVCRIDKCSNADVSAEDNAAVTFKFVKEIRQDINDNARIDHPVIIPERLKKQNSGSTGAAL